MKLQIENRIRAGYITVFILLGLSYISFFFATARLGDHTKNMEHTNQVINKLESLISYVKDAETGLRGYIAISDTRFLDTYNSSFDSVKRVYEELKELLKVRNEQQGRLSTLKENINEKYRLMRDAARLYTASGMQMSDSLKTLAYRGKNVMDNIRSVTKVMEKFESDQLEASTGKMNSVMKTLTIIISTSIIIAIILAIYSLLIYNRENKAKKLAAAHALEYRLELEKRVIELDEANRELRELKSIEKFAASGRIARQMAHEIRNPLTNIGLASEQLRSDLEGNEEHVIFFDMIDRNAKRINQLVSDLLNSTKFAQLQVESMPINDLINEVLEDANDRLNLKSIKLEKAYEEGMCLVAVDKERMKIALLNIIVNAIEAMEEGHGVLKIGTATIHGKCCVTITDNGVGINKDSMGKLFEPYFTGKSKGTGLGLTATQNIVLNHKGSIDVESEEGKGSTFIITLNFDGKSSAA